MIEFFCKVRPTWLMILILWFLRQSRSFSHNQQKRLWRSLFSTFSHLFNPDLSFTSRTKCWGKASGKAFYLRWKTQVKAIFFFLSFFLLCQRLPARKEIVIWQNFRFKCTNKWRRRERGHPEAKFQSPLWGWVCTALLLACLHFKSRTGFHSWHDDFYEIARPTECY